MRRYIVAILLTILPWVSQAIPQIQVWKTSDGVPVYFIRSASVPMLDVVILFNAGSIYDGQNPGLASVTNAMLGEGAKKLSSQQISEGFADVGAQFDEDISKEFATVSLRTLTDPAMLSPALALFNRVLTQMTFSKDDFHRVKNQALAGISDDEQDPFQVATKTFYEHLYAGSVYAHPVMGYAASINHLSRLQIEEFYRDFYTLRNAKILLVGDLTDQNAHQIADQLLKGLPEGQSKRVQVNVHPLGQSQVVRVSMLSNQSTILMGNLTIAQQDPSKFSLIVANQILGATGLTSLLADSVREKHALTYAIDSQFVPSFGLQPWLISLQTKNQSVNQAIALTQQVLTDFVRTGPTQAQLDQAKQYLLGSFPISFDSNDKLMVVLGFLVSYDYPLDFLSKYESNISKVTQASVKAAVQKELHPSQLLTVIVGGSSATSSSMD